VTGGWVSEEDNWQFDDTLVAKPGEYDHSLIAKTESTCNEELAKALSLLTREFSSRRQQLTHMSANKAAAAPQWIDGDGRNHAEFLEGLPVYAVEGIIQVIQVVRQGDKSMLEFFTRKIAELEERCKTYEAALHEHKHTTLRDNWVMQVAFERTLSAEQQNSYEKIAELREDYERTQKHKQELGRQLEQAVRERELSMMGPPTPSSSPLASEFEYKVSYEPPASWYANIPTNESSQGVWGDGYVEVKIAENSAEFSMLEELLNKNIGKHSRRFGTVDGRVPGLLDKVGVSKTGITPGAFKLLGAWRVHNQRLWKSYCSHKQLLRERAGHDGLASKSCSRYLGEHPMRLPLLDARTNEYWLFHGTAWDTMKVLTREGYDCRVSRTAGQFGAGFYLAENASKANQYVPCPECGGNALHRSPTKAGGCYSHCRHNVSRGYGLVLFRASLGDVHVAKQYEEKRYKGTLENPVRRPPTKPGRMYAAHDSVMGERHSHGGTNLDDPRKPLLYREVVLYDDGRSAYPEYILRYDRLPAPDNGRPAIVTHDSPWDTEPPPPSQDLYHTELLARYGQYLAPGAT